MPGDEVHFDHLSSPDLRGYDVLAFQRLWNRNHPEDLIDEDGLYGPQTAARLASAPADGFETGACSGTPPWDAELVATSAPSALPPGARATVVVEVRNTGMETWLPGATFLGTSDPLDRESALYDPASWVSPSRAATVEAETPPGEVGRFAFDVIAPDTQEATLRESFRLVEEGVSWFGPMSIDLEILVSSSAPEPDDSASLAGGCSAGGGTGSAPAALLLLAAAIALRRRR